MTEPLAGPGGRRSRAAALLAACCVVAAARGLGAEAFAIAAEPDWVRPVEVAEAVAEDAAAREAISDGVRYLVVDHQVRLGGREAQYAHLARRFLTEAGVADESTVELRFDPSFQTLTVHRLRLWRGTNVVDCLRTGAFRTLQRESSLEWKLLDGRLSVVALPEDVRVGDVLEVAFTTEGANPVFGGRYAGSFLLGWGTRVVRQRLRMLVPGDRPLRRLLHAGAPEPEESPCGDLREWRWDMTHAPLVQVDGATPSGYRPLPEVALSEYATWGEVAAWAAAQYPDAPPPAAAAARLAAWAALPTDEARVCAALSHVQDEIRYLGLESGTGSHRPTPPDQVLQRRFGDCKDKAWLLCTLLRGLGYDAVPALVHSALRQAVTNELPSPLAFDHVIVRVRLPGGAGWMDPTASHQRGGLQDRFLPPYGQALPVARDGAGFEPVCRPLALASRTHITESYSVPSFDGTATLVVRNVFVGGEAERLRARLAVTPREAIEKEYLNYYGQRYPGITSAGGVEVEDPPDANRLVLTERYAITNLWVPEREPGSGRIACEFRAQEIEAYAGVPATVIRTMPLGLPFPADIRQTIEVHLPEPWSVTPEEDAFASAGVRYNGSVRYTNGVLTLDYHLRTLADAVPAAATAAHVATLRRIRESLGYSLSCLHPSRRPREAGTGAAWVRRVRWPMVAGTLLAAIGLLVAAAIWVSYLNRAMRVRRTFRRRAATAAPPPLPPGP